MLDEHEPGGVNVLVVTGDTLSDRMAGPAIRAFEMAAAISKVAKVKLASTVRADITHPDFEILEVAEAGLRAAEDWADVIVFQGHLLAAHPWLKESEKAIVVDIYDPMHLEQLEQSRGLGLAERLHGSADIVNVLNEQIMRADFLMCASEKQRDFWLGQLAAVGRVNPLTYGDDPSLRRLLSVVPFGVADERPVQRKHGIKGVVPGIAPTDKVVLWGGGIYNWFDPLTLIRAIHQLYAKHPDVRLFFMGNQHPNPHVPQMQMVVEAHELAQALGLVDRAVFFNDGWVPYQERADYLLDADVGVSTHFDHLETAFSFRTRILDYLWTALPIVSTEGDTFARLIEEEHLGFTVPPENVDALANALETLLYDDAARQRAVACVEAVAERMRWASVLVPLTDFCSRPRRAPDLKEKTLVPLPRPGSAQRLHELEERVRGLETSSSWKVTAPLRRVSGALRLLSTRAGGLVLGSGRKASRTRIRGGQQSE